MPDPETRSDTMSHHIIGRDRDLSAVFDQLKTRSSQFIGIKAASGIGKTRLLKEVATRADQIGQRIFLISCRGTAHRAFQPLAMLVREVLSLDQSMPPDQQYDKLTQLLRDMKRPDLLEPFSKLLNVRPGTSSPAPDSTFIDHHEGDDLEEVFSSSASVSLADAILVLVANLASERPVAILFDDLDQSGMASTTAIFKLLNGIQISQGLPVNIVGSFTPDAPEELQSQAGDLVNTLAPLSQGDTSKLAAELAGGKSLDGEFAKRLGDIVTGSPLFLITIIDTFKADGNITVNGKGEVTSKNKQFPATFNALVEQRVNQLNTESQEVLKRAAVLGDGFRTGVMTALRGTGFQTASIQEELLDLVNKGWLETTGRGRQASYIFPSRAVRSAVYELVPEDQRKTLHNHAGDYYTVVTGGQKLRTEQAVYHYVQAGNADRALPVIDMAASRASAVNNPDRLIMLYRLGINVAKEGPQFEARQIDFAEKLGDQYASSGDYEKAAEAYTKYTPSMVPEALYNKLGVVLLAVDPPRANNVLSRALTIMQAGQQDDVRWAMEASIGWSLCLTNNHYDALRRCRDSLGRLGDTVGFGSARTLMRAVLGMILYYSGEPQEALPHLESARAGWGARNFSAGIMLINQVLIGLPKSEITKVWLKVILPIFIPAEATARV